MSENCGPLELNPIGQVVSSLKERAGAPHQGRGTKLTATIKIKPEFLPAAEEIKDGDLIWVLCWFDRADRSRLRVHPRGDRSQPLRGVFSTRSPARPNPVSLTLVEVIEAREGELQVNGLEALDGTPVLDIKPYIPGIDR